MLLESALLAEMHPRQYREVSGRLHRKGIVTEDGMARSTRHPLPLSLTLSYKAHPAFIQERALAAFCRLPLAALRMHRHGLALGRAIVPAAHVAPPLRACRTIFSAPRPVCCAMATDKLSLSLDDIISRSKLGGGGGRRGFAARAAAGSEDVPVSEELPMEGEAPMRERSRSPAGELL